MSESMSSPWIRDYLVDVAETYGAQLYNAPPMTNKKKKVQFIDFLTYHENSYVWAWISDKDFRVSARISKDAVDEYKSKHGRSVVDCRHYLIFISKFRPMFSPRPLGPKSPGNTPISHMSLEIDSVSFMGIGAHMFGTPRDLESDQKMNEWILGLRQDGGGGNVLKLRKQQDLEQIIKPPSPLPPPFSSYAPVSQHQITTTPEVSAKPEGGRSQDFQRLYAKRWRRVDRDRWKFAAKPEEKEQPKQAKSCHPLAESRSENANGFEPCVSEPPISPPRTPLHALSRRQGTPTEWSPSNRGSPIVTNVITRQNGVEQHDQSEILATSQIPFTEEHIDETPTASDSRSLQPPTPAQRIKPLIFSSSPPTGHSPEKFPSSSPRPVQQHPSSPLLPLDSSLPLPSSSLPEQIGVRRTIQRKVPHPGLSLPRPDHTKQGPVQILVPNSDSSGTTFSQSSSQSQRPSQSQKNQRQSLSRLPSFPSSLAQEFKLADSSIPREDESDNSKTRDAPKMISQPVSIRGDIDDQGNCADEDHASGRANVDSGKQEGSDSSRPPALSAPRIEILEVGTSDTEEEIEELDLTRSSAQMTTEFIAQSEARDTDKELANKDDRLPVPVAGTDKCSTPRNTGNTLHPAAVSTSAHGTNVIPRTSQRPGSQSSMHSLFSASSADESTPSSRAPILPIGRTDTTREMASPVHLPRHDPEAWKEPSFMAKNKGKGRARATEELDTPSTNAGQKRRLSAQSETPVNKRTKVVLQEVKGDPAVSGRTTQARILDRARQKDSGRSNLREIPPDNGPSRPPAKTAKTTSLSHAVHSPKLPLANFVVHFDNLGKGVPMPKLDLEDYNRSLLRTGWIRTQGDKVEKDGSAYIEI